MWDSHERQALRDMTRGELAFPTKSFKKGIGRTSPRFHSQCATSSHLLQSIVHLSIPREKRKVKEEKKKEK